MARDSEEYDSISDIDDSDIDSINDDVGEVDDDREDDSSDGESDGGDDSEDSGGEEDSDASDIDGDDAVNLTDNTEQLPALIRAAKRSAPARTINNTFPFSNVLSVNEKTAVIGFRAQQIAMGSDIYVKTYNTDDCFSIARRELTENKIPYIIDRLMPNGHVVSVKLGDLLDVHP